MIEIISLCGTTEQQVDTKRNEKDCMQERHKNYSFPYRSLEVLNKIGTEVVNAINIHDFRSKLDNSRFEYGTVRA